MSLRTIGIISIIVLFLLAGGGTVGTISYYRKYSGTKASLQCYIDEYGKLLGGFVEAKQLIYKLGERNQIIAKAAREGLQIIEGKYNH